MIYYFCSLTLLSKVSLTYDIPDTILYIAFNCQFYYLVSSILLANFELRGPYYTSVIGYSFLLQFYAT